MLRMVLEKMEQIIWTVGIWHWWEQAASQLAAAEWTCEEIYYIPLVYAWQKEQLFLLSTMLLQRKELQSSCQEDVGSGSSYKYVVL